MFIKGKDKIFHNEGGRAYLSLILTRPFFFLNDQDLISKMANHMLLQEVMSQSRLHTLALQFSHVFLILFFLQFRVDGGLQLCCYDIYLPYNQCFPLLQDLFQEKQNIYIAVRKAISTDQLSITWSCQKQFESLILPPDHPSYLH